MQTARSNGPRRVSSLLGRKIEEREDTCTTHGKFTSKNANFGGVARWTSCDKCTDEMIAAERVATEADRTRTARRDALLSGWHGAAIPARFDSASFETYKAETPSQQKVLAACQEYAAQWDDVSKTGRNLILCGLFGTGKTHLSISIARVVARRGDLPFFARTYEAVQFVRESYRPGAQRSERESIARLVDPDLLVLDEVGVQGGGDNEQMILFAILNGRYDACKPTVIVSNEDLSGIEKYLSARVVDRLREGGGRVLAFDWDSYRSQA
jgi:DNA replication protein DnaC